MKNPRGYALTVLKNMAQSAADGDDQRWARQLATMFEKYANRIRKKHGGPTVLERLG
jgi:hypothetical protein